MQKADRFRICRLFIVGREQTPSVLSQVLRSRYKKGAVTKYLCKRRCDRKGHTAFCYSYGYLFAFASALQGDAIIESNYACDDILQVDIKEKRQETVPCLNFCATNMSKWSDFCHKNVTITFNALTFILLSVIILTEDINH